MVVATMVDINNIETRESVSDKNISFFETCDFEEGCGRIMEDMFAGKVGTDVEGTVVVVVGGVVV